MRLILGIMTVLVLIFSVTSWADGNPTIVLKPGSTATIYDAPTDVVCSEPEALPFQRYCKCIVEGFSSKYSLSLILDNSGNSDELGKYDTQTRCESALSGNPACAGK